MIREIIKNVVIGLVMLYYKLMQYEKKYLTKPRVQFIYFHHVFPNEIPYLETFLKYILKYHTFISYSEAVQKIIDNEVDKPYVCLSSDDGFKNNLNAVKTFHKHNIKCCFFINPDSIGLTNPIKIRDYCNNKLMFPSNEFMNWKDIEFLISKGHEIGNHTISHINVGKTKYVDLKLNLKKSFSVIKKKYAELKHFAYPFGKLNDFNSEAFNLVFDLGHFSCASATRGCHMVDKKLEYNKLLIKRDLVIFNKNLNHIKYFLIKNSKNCRVNTKYFKDLP